MLYSWYKVDNAHEGPQSHNLYQYNMELDQYHFLYLQSLYCDEPENQQKMSEDEQCINSLMKILFLHLCNADFIHNNFQDFQHGNLVNGKKVLRKQRLHSPNR